jgi:hypothetical protein
MAGPTRSQHEPFQPLGSAAPIALERLTQPACLARGYVVRSGGTPEVLEPRCGQLGVADSVLD